MAMGRRSRRAGILFDVPLPRRIASRPVDWMAETMEEGDAVPVTVRVCVGREASMAVMPVQLSGLLDPNQANM